VDQKLLRVQRGECIERYHQAIYRGANLALARRKARFIPRLKPWAFSKVSVIAVPRSKAWEAGFGRALSYPPEEVGIGLVYALDHVLQYLRAYLQVF
jgi:hypothetical protein